MPVCFSSTTTKVALSEVGSAIAKPEPARIPAIARATNLHIGWSWGALFPFFLLMRLRASLHVRLFHVRLARPRHNLTAIHDLSGDLATRNEAGTADLVALIL